MSKPTLTTPSEPPTLAGPDAPTRTRIITHMNADHAGSLALFLRHYNRLKPRDASTARLVDVSLTHMTVESSFGRCYVPFDPPMDSYGEARGRMVAMHRECLRGLGESDVVIGTWTPPTKPLHVFFFCVCALIFTTFPWRENFLGPGEGEGGGGWAWMVWSLGGGVPGLARLCWRVQPFMTPFMVVVHGTELSWMLWSRLRKYRVPVLSAVWCLWVVDTFIEGFGCFERFDGLVREKEREMAQGDGQGH